MSFTFNRGEIGKGPNSLGRVVRYDQNIKYFDAKPFAQFLFDCHDGVGVGKVGRDYNPLGFVGEFLSNFCQLLYKTRGSG